MKRGFDRWLAREVPGGGAAAVAWSTELAAAGISSGSPVRGPHVPGADYLGVSAADAYYDMGIPAGGALCTFGVCLMGMLQAYGLGDSTAATNKDARCHSKK